MDLNYAMSLLDIALEYNEFYQFLEGSFKYNLYGKDGYGGREHDFALVIRAIYEKYKSDQSISKKFEDSLLDTFTNCKGHDYFMRALNVLKYHMNCEKVGSAPFKINVDKLLKAARDNIAKNKEAFARTATSDNFMFDFITFDNNLKETYGRRIL